MSVNFDSMCDYLKSKTEIHRTDSRIKGEIKLISKIEKITEEDFYASFKENNDQFKVSVVKMFMDLEGRQPDNFEYAGVIMNIAESLGLDYKVYAGLAMPRGEDASLYNNVPNHIYVLIGDKQYELFKGVGNLLMFSNIEHVKMQEV